MRTISDAERRARIGVRHALARPVDDTEQATRAVTCLHATEPASVYLSAHARSRAARADIDSALYDDRTIVRQLAMRRTVFAFPRDLLPSVWVSASARVAGQQATRVAKDVEQTGIARDGRAWLAEVSEQVRALLDVAPRTTAQLRAELPELAKRLVPPDNRNGPAVPVAPRVLTVLAAGGSIVRGHNNAGWKTSRPFWTATAQWLDDDSVRVDDPGRIDSAGRADRPGRIDEAAGYAELVRRWLWSFGPGTEADLVWWLGATKAIVRQALADVGATTVELEDGTPAWLHPDDTEKVAPPRPWAALLPSLDPTTMGWKERRFYLGDHAERIFDRNGNGGPTAWWNGRIVGGWTQDDDAQVVVVPAAPLPQRAAAALNRKAAELTAWLDGDQVRSIYQTPLAR